MLKGRSAVVTGSTSGIGLAIAEALAKEGANVALNSFTDAPDDHALAEKIAAEHGVKVKYIKADMAEPAGGLYGYSPGAYGFLRKRAASVAVGATADVAAARPGAFDEIVFCFSESSAQHHGDVLNHIRVA